MNPKASHPNPAIPGEVEPLCEVTINRKNGFPKKSCQAP